MVFNRTNAQDALQIKQDKQMFPIFIKSIAYLLRSVYFHIDSEIKASKLFSWLLGERLHAR